MVRPRKTKMVSFRVSSEEYEALKTLHRSFGHRSISELARSAVQQLIVHLPSHEESVEGRFLELSDRLNALDRQFADLRQLIEHKH
jgi:hypothetical protein